MIFRRLALVTFVVFFTASARAEVVRIEVKSRADVLSGKTFGKAGAYEKLAGKIYFAVDPGNSANRIITDIDKAPKNASGKVEFSSDFYLIKPKDESRGNGTVLYEVSNRGNKGLLGFFNLGTNSLDPETARDFGDGFLMDQGFTVLWVGWQFDAPNRDGMLRVYVPPAHEANGLPIQGLVRSDFSTTQKTKAPKNIARQLGNGIMNPKPMPTGDRGNLPLDWSLSHSRNRPAKIPARAAICAGEVSISRRAWPQSSILRTVRVLPSPQSRRPPGSAALFLTWLRQKSVQSPSVPAS